MHPWRTALALLLLLDLGWPTTVRGQLAPAEQVAPSPSPPPPSSRRDVGIALIVIAAMLTGGGAAMLYWSTFPRVNSGTLIELDTPMMKATAGWALIAMGQAVACGGIALTVVRTRQGRSRVTISGLR